VRVAKQVGVNYAIAGVKLGRVRREQYVETLQKIKDGHGGVSAGQRSEGSLDAAPARQLLHNVSFTSM